MPRGIFFLGWDDTLGCVLRAKYPPEANLDSDAMTQYLATIQALGVAPTVQVQDEHQSTLLYGIPVSARKAGTSRNNQFLVILLNEGEAGKIKRYEVMLSAEGPAIFSAPRQEQEKIFLKFARTINQPPARKVVFLGFANAGKTSTKQFIFEKARDDRLLETPLEPTLGVDTIAYNLLDLDVSLFDTSGQELDRWFDPGEGIFAGADLIIFFFTPEDWHRDAQRVRTYLEKLEDLLPVEAENPQKVIIFCHKADLLAELGPGCKEEIRTFTAELHLPVFFTSIVRGGNEDLFLGMQVLLRHFSQYLGAIRKFLNPLIHRFEIQPLFLVDAGERVVADYFSADAEVLKTIHNVRAIYPGIFDIFAATFQHSPDMLIFALPDNQAFILCLSCAQISPDLGHIFLQSASIDALQKFHSEYHDLVKSLDWRARKSN